MPLVHSSCLHFKLLWCVCQLSQPVKQVHWHRQWFEWLPQSVKNRVSTAVLCVVVLQKAATDLPTTTTSKWSFGTATRGHFVSMVQAVGACSLPPCNFYFLVNKIPLPPTEATNELLGQIKFELKEGVTSWWWLERKKAFQNYCIYDRNIKDEPQKVSPPPSSWATRGIVRSQLVFQINTSHVLIARKDGMLLTWGASFIHRTVTVWFRLKFDDSTATWQLSNQRVINWFPFLVGEFPHASAW